MAIGQETRFGAKTTADEVLAGVELGGKRFLVTGISSGIGMEIARALVSRGAHVTGAVRDVAKATTSLQGVRDAAADAAGSLALLPMDLASLHSVRAAADRLLADGRPFDAIIANAGIMATSFERTVDGFERQFATNHLGHFALLQQIAPLLVDNGRLVVLSSQAHRIADVDLDDPGFEHQPYDPWLAYARSKTANVLFAVEFDRRHRERGIRAAAVMPGNSFTGLVAHFTEQELQMLLDSSAKERAEAGLPPGELKDIGQAAATPVWAAVVADKDEIGGRYLEDCATAEIDETYVFADGVKRYALDADNARRLWVRSEELIGQVPADRSEVAVQGR